MVHYQQCSLYTNNHLPVPPCQKLLYFVLLVRILEQLKNADIKMFRVSHKISAGEDLGQHQRKTRLFNGISDLLVMHHYVTISTYLRCHISNGCFGDNGHPMEAGIA